MAKKKIHERQNFIRYFKEFNKADLVDMNDVAALAEKMGWPMPSPPTARELLARQFSEAAREEIRHDQETKQPYRASLAFNQRKSNGKQETLWLDVDEAPRHHMIKGLTSYRDQMVGEAVMATNTADHWNRVHPEQLPLVFHKDFTEDVEERRNYRGPNEKAG